MTLAAGVDAGFARRAEALHLQGDGAEALCLLTAGVRRFPGDVTALLVLARVCRESGREDEAREWLEAALRLDPACPGARMALDEPAAGPKPEVTPAPRTAPVAPTAPIAPVVEPTAPATPEPSVPEEPSHGSPFSPIPQFVPRATPRKPAAPVPSPFAFPVAEEDEEPEIEENSAPHVATATLAEIYLQQGLKEQAAQIYRQILEQQPGDDAVRKRLDEILREPEGS